MGLFTPARWITTSACSTASRKPAGGQSRVQGVTVQPARSEIRRRKFRPIKPSAPVMRIRTSVLRMGCLTPQDTIQEIQLEQERLHTLYVQTSGVMGMVLFRMQGLGQLGLTQIDILGIIQIPAIGGYPVVVTMVFRIRHFFLA